MATLFKLLNGEYIDPDAVKAIRYGETNEWGHPNRMIVDFSVEDRHYNHYNCIICPVQDRAEFDAEAKRLNEARKVGY